MPRHCKKGGCALCNHYSKDYNSQRDQRVYVSAEYYSIIKSSYDFLDRDSLTQSAYAAMLLPFSLPIVEEPPSTVETHTNKNLAHFSWRRAHRHGK